MHYYLVMNLIQYGKSFKKNASLLNCAYNFIFRVSNSFSLQSSLLIKGSVLEDVKNLGLRKPEVTKALIDQALKDKSLSKIRVDIQSEEF